MLERIIFSGVTPCPKYDCLSKIQLLYQTDDVAGKHSVGVLGGEIIHAFFNSINSRVAVAYRGGDFPGGEHPVMNQLRRINSGFNSQMQCYVDPFSLRNLLQWLIMLMTSIFQSQRSPRRRGCRELGALGSCWIQQGIPPKYWKQESMQS